MIIILLLIVLIAFLLYIITYYQAKADEYSKVFLKNDIYLKQSDIGGIGVFANKDFKAYEVIEVSPYIEDIASNYGGVTLDYIFQKTSEPEKSIVAFGYASLYNHSDEPSVQWKIHDKYMSFISVKPIQKGEELCISYGPKYWSTPQRQSIKK